MIIEIRNEIYQTLKKENSNHQLDKDLGLKSEKIEFTSDDGLILCAELVKTDYLNPKGTIILVHGIRAYKEHFLPIAKLLSINGFNSVLIDLRAHGQSEGKYCTFGYYEKFDIENLIDTLILKEDITSNIGIWGQSLGAAVAIQTLEIDKRLKFGIIESTFSDFEIIVGDYAKNKLGFSIPLLNKYLIWRAENIGNFEASKIKPSESVKSINQRILMVHGKLDKRIKFEYGQENFNNLRSNEKEFIELKEANHLNVWQVGGDEYFNKVIAFINQE